MIPFLGEKAHTLLINNVYIILQSKLTAQDQTSGLQEPELLACCARVCATTLSFLLVWETQQTGTYRGTNSSEHSSLIVTSNHADSRLPQMVRKSSINVHLWQPFGSRETSFQPPSFFLEMILSKENNGARQLNSIPMHLNWIAQTGHTIATEQLLIWNLPVHVSRLLPLHPRINFIRSEGVRWIYAVSSKPKWIATRL